MKIVVVKMPKCLRGMGKTVDVLSKLSPNAKWQTGKMANGISEKEIENWVNNL